MKHTTAIGTTLKQVWDGSYVMTCLRCFSTIGNAMDVVTLDDKEIVHVCEQSFLAERGLFTRRRVH